MGIRPYYNDGNGILVYYGDCFEVMKQFEDKSFDLVLTDPPYGITACKWDMMPDLDKLWEVLKPLGKDNTAYVFTASQPFTSKLVMSNLKWFKYEWIWDKKKPAGFQLVKYRPMIKHENIIIFCKSTPKYFPIKTPRDIVKRNSFQSKSESSPLAYHDGKERIYTDYYPKSIIEITNANQKGRVHPTQKPVALMEYLIRTYTNKGDLVLDPFTGSGTTLVAAKMLGRKTIGIEINEKYCEVAKERLKATSVLLL